MSIDHITATKYFDEIRKHFGFQTDSGIEVDLSVKETKLNGAIPAIAIFDNNNPQSKPFVLMSCPSGSGRRWSNETSGETFYVVNSVLRQFDKKKEDWSKRNYDFTLKDTEEFLIEAMKQVSSFLR